MVLSRAQRFMSFKEENFFYQNNLSFSKFFFNFSLNVALFTVNSKNTNSDF
jgi:hypothetical protein